MTFGAGIAPTNDKRHGEVSMRLGHLWIVRAKSSFCGIEGAGEVLFRLVKLLLAVAGETDVRQALRHVRVVGPQGLVHDRQQPLVLWLGLVVLALAKVEMAKGVDA